MSELDFRVLGPVEVIADGRVLPLGSGVLTDLLAALAVVPDQVVSARSLAETVWYERGPVHPRQALQSAVARLRRVVGSEYIETLPSGYRLRAQADQLDLIRFERLVAAAGRQREPRAAVAVLAQAVGLWRGTPLENVSSPVLLNSAVPRLADRYLTVCEEWAALCLRAGQPDAPVSRLAALVEAHPFREGLTGLLMLTYYRSSRQADALTAYEALRGALSEELGVDPGQALQELHLKILRADPSLLGGPDDLRWSGPGTMHALSAGNAGNAGDISAAGDCGDAGDCGEAGDAGGEPSPAALVPGGGSPVGVPRQLPAAMRVFTGRQAELTRLLDLGNAADGGSGPGTVVISAIDGMAGIGKTALAVHAAHRLAERFDGGQLFIDLHGYTQGLPPRTAEQALGVFLRALGVPPQQIPEDDEERAALYRERLAGTRTLIVLDNAFDEAQVRPLIPGGAGCLVLVTSRRKLTGLDDAHTVALDVLPQPEAVALFRAVAGPQRVEPGDPAVADIAALCGHLPLALRIAAALLRNRPSWSPAHLAGRLRAGQARLDALSGGDQDLAAVFGLSTQNLRADQLRLYRYLGLALGPETDAYAAAALLGDDPAAAERLLQDLVDDNLLAEPAAGRYRMHDLIRAHTRTLAGQDPEGDRRAALGRLLDYYQDAAARANARIAPGPGPRPAGRGPV
ncbi:MAG: BTAD domain-containing putative transcriptional regulator, partial [Streptosporangiaceae bacterium]